MKKIVVLIAAILVAAPAFALPQFRMSAGGGGIFNTHWMTGTLQEQFRDYGSFVPNPMNANQQTIRAMGMGQFDTAEVTFGGGIFGFFDATFATLGVGLLFNNVNQTVTVPSLQDVGGGIFVPTGQTSEQERSFTIAQLNISLMFKYPFAINDSWTIFPMLGIDSQIALGMPDDLRRNLEEAPMLDVPSAADYWNSLWIRFGAGADFALTGNLFIRSELLYGFKLNSRFKNDMADFWERNIAGVTNGLQVRIALGYTFR